jgi:hypothetical protein
MGTSKSSTGSPSNVPMVPPWTPEPVAPAGAPEAFPPQPVPSVPSPPNVPIAPARRFGAARTSLGSFAKTGSAADMRRGIGHYARKGMGGGGVAAQRMGATARTGGALYGALSGLAAGQTNALASGEDRNSLQGRSVEQIITAIVESVRPVDGTQDAESARDALQGALSADLLDQYPDADLLNLSEDERLFIVERYTALDVFNQLELNVGKAIQNNAPNITTYLSRLREVKNYVKQTVAARFREIKKAGASLNPRTVAGIVRQAIQQTFEVFGEAEE